MTSVPHLGHEDAGALGQSHQVVTGTAVAGVGHPSIAIAGRHPERRDAVLHHPGLDSQVADLGDAAILQLHHLEEVAHLVIGCALYERLHAGGPAGRPKDGDLAQRRSENANA